MKDNIVILVLTLLGCCIYFYIQSYHKIENFNTNIKATIEEKKEEIYKVKEDILKIKYYLISQSYKPYKVLKSKYIINYKFEEKQNNILGQGASNEVIYSFIPQSELKIQYKEVTRKINTLRSATIDLKSLNIFQKDKGFVISLNISGKTEYINPPSQEAIFDTTIRLDKNFPIYITYGFDKQIYNVKKQNIYNVAIKQGLIMLILLNITYLALKCYIKHYTLCILTTQLKQETIKTKNLEVEKNYLLEELFSLKNYIIEYKNYNRQIYHQIHLCGTALNNSLINMIENQESYNGQLLQILKKLKLLVLDIISLRCRRNYTKEVNIEEIIGQATKFTQYELRRKKNHLDLNVSVKNIVTDIDELIVKKVIFSFIFIVSRTVFKKEMLKIEVVKDNELLVISVNTGNQALGPRMFLEDINDPLILNYQDLVELLEFYKGNIIYRTYKKKNILTLYIPIKKNLGQINEKKVCEIYNISDFI